MARFLFAFLCIAVGLTTLSAQSNLIRQYRQQNEHRLLNDFIDLLKIPNVASDTPNIRRNAEYLGERPKSSESTAERMGDGDK